jgi:hypothetical protein
VAIERVLPAIGAQRLSAGAVPQQARIGSLCGKTVVVPDSPDRILPIMEEAAPTRRPMDRVEDAMREIGTLIIAFAPLDAVYSAESGNRPRSVLLFVLWGLSFFFGALFLEWRRAREH